MSYIVVDTDENDKRMSRIMQKIMDVLYEEKCSLKDALWVVFLLNKEIDNDYFEMLEEKK